MYNFDFFYINIFILFFIINKIIIIIHFFILRYKVVINLFIKMFFRKGERSYIFLFFIVKLYLGK